MKYLKCELQYYAIGKNRFQSSIIFSLKRWIMMKVSESNRN